VDLEPRTTKDTNFWGLGRAFEKIACSGNSQDGTRLQAPNIEGYKGLCPCFTAVFAAPRPRGQLAQLGSGTMKEKMYPCLPWLPSSPEALLLGSRQGEPALPSSWAPNCKGTR